MADAVLVTSGTEQLTTLWTNKTNRETWVEFVMLARFGVVWRPTWKKSSSGYFSY